MQVSFVFRFLLYLLFLLLLPPFISKNCTEAKSSDFMPVNKLVPLLGTPFPVPEPGRGTRFPSPVHASRCPKVQQFLIDPPGNQKHHTRNRKACDGEKEPMIAHPEDQSRVILMPAIAFELGKETPRVFLILRFHQDAHTTLACIQPATHVLFPQDREEEWARAVHYRYVRKTPVAVVGLERLYYEKEERMLRSCTHCVVGNTGGESAMKPTGVDQ